MDREDLFKNVHLGINSDKPSIERALRMVIKKFPDVGSFPHISSLCKRQTGKDRVTLSWFSEEFNSFPLNLTYQSIPWIRDMWSGLYGGFKKTDLYISWQKEKNSFETKSNHGMEWRPLCLVFEWPKWGICCMHNKEVDNSESKDFIRIHRTLDNGEKFIIEPFGQLLDGISWSP